MNSKDVSTILGHNNQNEGDMNGQVGIDKQSGSFSKTPLGLNQWVLTDKPTMNDFNEDNQIIDGAITELREELGGISIPRFDFYSRLYRFPLLRQLSARLPAWPL